MTMLRISITFDSFLDGLEPKKRECVKSELRALEKGELDIAPKKCTHVQDREKVLLEKCQVVIIYEIKGDDIVLIEGCLNYERAA